MSAYDDVFNEGRDAGQTSALSALKSGDVLPGGELMVVPVRPTEAMLAAGVAFIPGGGDEQSKAFSAKHVLQAMLAAAQTSEERDDV